MYFNKFDTFLYDFNIGGETKYLLVKDITQNVRIRKQLLSNITLYDEYDIMDGETPEMIADKIYGSPNYHWVVMLANGKYDHVNDFPLSTYDLEQHIKAKYGNNLYATHHYVDPNGYIVDKYNVNGTPVSNYDYENILNESKRRIKLISPKLLSTLLKNFEELI